MSNFSNQKRNVERMQPRQDVSPAMAAFNIGGHGRTSGVVSEEPQMRSVAIMGSSAPSMARGIPGGLKIAPPSMGFGAKGLGLGPPPKFGKPAKLSMRSASDGFGVKKEWDQLIAAPSSWDVKGESLDLVPVDYPLERTHREIDGIDAGEVANRISVALRKLSIDAEYDASKGKAKCKTSDLVKFRIRLYAGTTSGMPVVVEVQRRSGSASSFMRSCRAILKAAEGSSAKALKTEKKVPPSFKGRVAEMKCLKSVASNETVEDDAVNALNSSIAMFRSKNLDSNLLALENMCSLTDPVKTSPTAALIVSKRIILGDEKNDIREDILALLQRDVFVSDVDENEGTDHAECLRHHALVLLANAIEICSKDGHLVDSRETKTWFENCLIPSLVDEVKSAGASATNAFQAVRCLQNLASCNDAVCSAIRNNGGVEAIDEAHEFALEHHDLLAEETSRFLSVMKSTKGY